MANSKVKLWPVESRSNHELNLFDKIFGEFFMGEGQGGGGRESGTHCTRSKDDLFICPTNIVLVLFRLLAIPNSCVERLMTIFFLN